MRVAGSAVHVLALACLAGLLVFPFLGGRYWVDQITYIMINAILAQSLALLIGGAGLVSLGHAAFFGAAAYMVYILTGDAGGSAFWILPATIAVAAVLALVIGALVMRTRAVYFIMATLAFGQMVFFFFHDTEVGGGADGAFIMFKPTLAVGETTLLDLGDRMTMYAVTLAAMLLVLALVAQMMRSPFGRTIVGIRHNEERMRALGYEPLRFKLAVFVIAGALAGLAGFLYATKSAFVNPELAAWHLSAEILILVILGGLANVTYGPILGAFAYGLGRLFLEGPFHGFVSRTFGLDLGWQFYLAVILILVVLFLPRGLMGALDDLFGLIRRRPKAPDATGEAVPRG